MRKHVAAGLLVALALTGCREIGTSDRGSASATATLPNVVGKRLADAQDTLHSAGFTKLKPTDSTGQARFVINNQNWIVRSQSPAAGPSVRTHDTITLGVSKPSDGAGSTTHTAGVVPTVVCKDLQSAQNALRAAGFFNLGSQDGTGKARNQLVDRNWVVTAQSAAAGSRPATDTRIVLTVVKFGEDTGSSGCAS